MSQPQSNDSLTQEPPTVTRAEALKQATRLLHEQVDGAMTGAHLFDSRERYAKMLELQHDFQWLTSGLYQDPALNAWLPGLSARDRYPAIVQDCRDLGLEPSEPQRSRPEVAAGDEASKARALGWLYTNEGSTMGAAFLYKWAESLGLNGEFGARHLAADPEGRGLHWRKFVEQINAAPIAPEHEKQVIRGAEEAFQAVLGMAKGLAFA